MTSYLHAQATLASAVRYTVNRALNDHYVRNETLSEQTVKDGAAVGFVDIEGAGEILIEISFPLQFFERPLFTAGFELRDTFTEFGKFPEWSATVAAWRTLTDNDTLFYIGALVAVRTFNTTHSTLHYSFQARAFTNPSGPDTSVEASL